MRPVLEKNKFGGRHIIYIVLVIICIVAIGIGVYMQFFRDEKLGVIFGISKEKEDLELKEIKENFMNIFSNDLTIVKEYNGQIEKIKEDMDLIVLANDTEEKEENYTVNLKIPYFNIKSEKIIKMNQEINKVFGGKSERVLASTSKDNIIFNVKYKAYLNENILSLIILSELKEGNDNQRIIMKTYNYNLKENKEITINDVISGKNLDIQKANKHIKETIDSSQKASLDLKEMGYAVNVRDSNSDEYKIENAQYFFIGEKGYVYVIYPYGNKEFTSENDVIVFK